MWFWQKNDMKSAYGIEHYFQEPSSPLLSGMVDHESLWGSKERRGEYTEINKKSHPEDTANYSEVGFGLN